MFSNLLLILGVAVLSVSLRTFRHPWLQMLGLLGVLATSFLAGYLLSGENIVVGILCAGSWLLLPWLEILTRVRKLSLPQEKSLRHKAPPNAEAFPALNDLTEEIEGEDFEHVDDVGWEWEDHEQFFRLFYKNKERTQSAICLVDQHDVAFYYLSLSSRAKDGRVWTTWNYPFSYSLKLSPSWRVKRLRGEKTFLEMYETHKSFLSEQGVRIDDLEDVNPELIQLEIQKDMQAQIAHNLASGVLWKDAQGAVRYSWRGMFYIWFQFLRDFVRLG